MSDALHERTACQLSADLSAGRLTATALMEHTLARIAAVNPSINAIVSLRPHDELMQEAERAEQRLRNGNAADSGRQWLQGIPFAVKDLSDTAGLTTTYGSPLFSQHVPVLDDPMVARLKAAGAIIIGKTNTPEFGLGSQTYNTVHGPTRNPYDTRLTPGGSSGGAAAALAARLLPVADGSDMMGSLRNPAAWCNVYGFRPGAGVILDESLQPGDTDAVCVPLATNGPMARTIVDLVRLLDTLASPSRKLPWNPPTGPAGYSHCISSIGAGARPADGLRIGWLADFGGHYPMSPGVLSLCETALGVFGTRGVEVEPIVPDFDPESLWQAWVILRSVRMASRFGDLVDDTSTRDLLKPELHYEVELGRRQDALALHRSMQVQNSWWQTTSRLFDRYDALALPSAQVFPFVAEQSWPTRINSQAMMAYHEWMSVVIPASLIGLPALNVPAGFNAGGLPMGMQLIGARLNDRTILQLGEHYHRATDWPHRCPPALREA